MMLSLTEGKSQSATQQEVCFLVAQIVKHGLEPHWKGLGVVILYRSLSSESLVVRKDSGADCSESRRRFCAEIGAQT
jgi:hypothetical protein